MNQSESDQVHALAMWIYNMPADAQLLDCDGVPIFRLPNGDYVFAENPSRAFPRAPAYAKSSKAVMSDLVFWAKEACTKHKPSSKTALQITLKIEPDAESEKKLLSTPTEWEYIISGYWGEDSYHRGYIEYHMACMDGVWWLKSTERNASLELVTQEDIEAGALSDDQIQDLQEMTLAEAQNLRHEKIFASLESVPPNAHIGEIATVLYKAALMTGAHAVAEPDGNRFNISVA
jgi:hypothetical protein